MQPSQGPQTPTRGVPDKGALSRAAMACRGVRRGAGAQVYGDPGSPLPGGAAPALLHTAGPHSPARPPACTTSKRRVGWFCMLGGRARGIH